MTQSNELYRIHIDILLEEYRTVSQEIQLYLNEIIRCFLYATVLVGIYLGWGIADPNGISQITQKIANYIPYGFFILGIYFLSLSYIRLSLAGYRAILENKINKYVGSNLMNLNSKYLEAVHEKGTLRISKKWYGILPTPMIFLGILIFIASILIFFFSKIATNRYIILILMFLCGLVALYVFFVYPTILKKNSNFYKKAKK
jgi:VIT1/CCC1 family predicted Fe2+/Mn2+ transporter